MKKYEHIFDTSNLQSDLKRRSLRSGAVTLSSQGIQFIIQLGSTMILARILSPQDYGINAMAVAITGFAGIFLNLGLSTATIQRTEITHEQVSTLFWINAGIGVFLTLITAAIAPGAAWFYKTPEMLGVMLSLSIIFTISGLCVQHSALLTRRMRFYSLAKIRIISLLSGIIVAVITGSQGFGYWALVFNTLTNVTVHTVGCWLACKWVPGPPSRYAGVGPMIKFGSDLVGFEIINYFSRNLDNILIGRYHGSGPLGLYSKAYQLLMMPITNLRGPISTVALPALSRLQDNPEQYRNYYLKTTSLLAFISMPLVIFLFVCSDRLINLLLGPQWMGASEIFKILAFAALIQPVASTRGLVLISTGQSRKYLYWGVINAFFTILSFAVGLPWGPKGVATTYASVNYLLLYPSLFYVFNNTPIRINDFFSGTYKQFFASIIMGFICFFLLDFLKEFSDLFVLISCSIAAFVVFLLVTILMPGGLKDCQEYYSYGRLIFTKK